jgi:hypothetical protein
MVDLVIAPAGSAFVCRAWGLIKRLLSPREESWFLWCAAKRSLTLVDTETIAQATGPDRTVTHCLLWSEDHECDQRCMRGPGEPAGDTLADPDQTPAGKNRG